MIPFTCVCGRALSLVELAMPNGSLVVVIPRHEARMPIGDGRVVVAECPFGGARARVVDGRGRG